MVQQTGSLHKGKIWLAVASVLGGILLVLGLVLFFSVKNHKRIIGALKSQVEKLQVEKKVMKVQIEKEKEKIRFEQLKKEEGVEETKIEEAKKKIKEIEKREKKLEKDYSKIKKEVDKMPLDKALQEARKLLKETL